MGFSNVPGEFDWGVDIPDSAQLVIVTLEGFDNVFGEVTWGYGAPIDNGDGVASNPTGATQLLGTTTISPNPWGGAFPAQLLFYTFTGEFDGVREDFFLSLNDLADTEVDAAFIIDAALPPACTPPPDGLVSWWPGDGNANDIVDDNHGTLRNGATFGAGIVGEAFSFDGLDDFVDIGDIADFEMTSTSSMSITGWVKTSMTGREARASMR